MTCAGIASMVIAGDMLHEPDAKVSGDQIDGCYRAPSADLDRIDSGVEWLRKHFTVQGNPPATPADAGLWHYYYLYGLERAGRLSARRKIGEYDWYREGAKYLVQAIGTVVSRSSWKGRAMPKTTKTSPPAWPCCSSPRDAGPCSWPRCNTVRRPGRLGRDIPWNRHRNDINNLTIYVEVESVATGRWN